MSFQKIVLILCLVCLTTIKAQAHAPQKSYSSHLQQVTHLTIDELTKKVHDQVINYYHLHTSYPNASELIRFASLNDYSYNDKKLDLYQTPKIYKAPPDSIDLDKTIVYYAEGGAVFVSFRASFQISTENDAARSSLITQRMYIILRFCALGKNSSEEGANLILEMLGECQIDPIVWHTSLKKMYDIFYPCISDYLLEEIDESTTLSYAHWLAEIFEEEANKLFSP